MITALKLFRNIGQFDSTATNVALTPLTLIYAENGRGKTTLAAVLRSLATGSPIPITERRRLAAAHPPYVVIECTGGPPAAIFENGGWNRTLPVLVIFDDAFVDKNVYSGLSVEPDHRQHLHELILGETGVALNRALQEAVDQVEDSGRELRAKADAIPADKRGPFGVDQFCALAPRDDIETAILATERNLAAARHRNSVAIRVGFDLIDPPEFVGDELIQVLGTTVETLDARANARVQEHLATLDVGGEAWVSEGMRRLAVGEDDPHCPFCAQGLIGSPVIAHYRAYFGAEYAQLQASIADYLDWLDGSFGGDELAGFERDFRTWVETRQFWSNFSEVAEISIDTSAFAQAWTNARDAVRDLVLRKKASPLDSLPVSDAAQIAIVEYAMQRQWVVAMSDALQASNFGIAVVKERAAVQNTAALAVDLAMQEATRARFTPEFSAACEEYLAARIAKTAAEQRRDDARSALDNHRQTIFQTFQSAINIYLQRFNAGFRLDRVTSVNTRGGSSCTYNVLINNQPIAIGPKEISGEPSFRTSLSAGDRNTLALAFFFASLDQDVELADKIVVIDDPITSLDEHRSLATVQEIRRLATRAGQVIVLSHDKPFLCRVWQNADRNSRTALELVRDGDGSTIRPWDVNADLVTEHDLRHATFMSFLGSAAHDNKRQVAEALRPHLEAFLRVAYPGEFPPGTLLGPFRTLCEQRLSANREILGQRDIDELRELTEYANLFHHNTNLSWQTVRINDAELLGFVRRVLDFVRL